MSDNTVPATADAEARQASPGSNFASSSLLHVNGGGSSDARQAFIHFSAPFTKGSTILSATITLYLAAGTTGTNDLTLKRITEKWAESKLKWSNKPATTNTHSATPTSAVGVADAGTAVVFDVKDMLQDLANSSTATFFGVRLELAQHKTDTFHSTEAPDPDTRPVLLVTWSEAPETPDRLSPDGDLAVSVEFPFLTWDFVDKAGDTTQASAQIQLDQDPTALVDDGSGATFDSGKITLEDPAYDTSSGAFAGVDNGDTWYWRVKVWDGTDLESDWSEVAEFNRTDLASLTIDSPGSTVPETTPPIEWTFGGTQETYEVILYRVEEDVTLTELWSEKGTDDSTTSVTPPAGLIKTGETYAAAVIITDDVDRVDGESVSADQAFTYVRDGSPDPVDTLTATGYTDPDGATTPAVQLDWTRDTAPDYWCLVVDGKEVADRIELDDTHMAGDNYRLIYWGLTPRVAHTYSIEAVQLDGGVFKQSAPGPEATLATQPVGIWLTDRSTPTKDAGTIVGIYGQDEADMAIGEMATTYYPVDSQAPVRITNIIRGYEGSITGILISGAARDRMLALKRLETDLLLVIGDLCLTIRLEDTKVNPTPTPGDTFYSVGFSFFQSAGPWPVRQ